MVTRIQYRRDTAANWLTANPVLAQGEAGYETDTNLLKIGDGVTGWVALPYPDSVTPETVAANLPERLSEESLTTTYVRMLGPSNGVDDTPTIQATLDDVRLAGGGLVLGKPGTWYKTMDRLVVGSNTTIDACVEQGTNVPKNILNNWAFINSVRTISDAEIAAGSYTLTSASAAFTSVDVGRTVSVVAAGPDGVSANGGVTGVGPIHLSARIVSITNATTAIIDTAASTTVNGAEARLYDRDKNITIRGRWISHNTGGPGTDAHHMLICRVDGINIDLDSFVADKAGSKYAIYVADYTRLDMDVRGLDAISDGVHLQGPARGPNLVRNIEGKSHDDFLAVGTGDNTGGGRQLFSGGSMDLEVQTLRPSLVGTHAALKLYGLLGHTINFKCGSIKGSDAGVTLGAADVQGVYLEDVAIGSIDNATTVAVSIYANAGHISLREVTNRNSSAASVVYGVNVTEGFAVNLLDIGELTMPNAGGTSPGGAAINVAGSLVDLNCGRFVGTIPASGACLMLKSNAASVTRAMLSNVTQTGGGALIKAPFAGQKLGEVWISNVYVTGASFLVDLATATVMYLSNVAHNAGTSGSMSLRATAAVTVLGHGASRMFGNMVTAAGYSLRMNCADFPTDVAKVTSAKVGDRIDNQNANAAPYVIGALTRDSSGAWIPSMGYAKKGTATLVGGTVTVSDTKVTGSAQVAVSILVPGGTVGAPYVAVRTAGTGFTIASTSTADTSVVLYQVLAY